jgi:hypothetical protein
LHGHKTQTLITVLHASRSTYCGGSDGNNGCDDRSDNDRGGKRSATSGGDTTTPVKKKRAVERQLTEDEVAKDGKAEGQSIPQFDGGGDGSSEEDNNDDEEPTGEAAGPTVADDKQPALEGEESKEEPSHVIVR